MYYSLDDKIFLVQDGKGCEYILQIIFDNFSKRFYLSNQFNFCVFFSTNIIEVINFIYKNFTVIESE